MNRVVPSAIARRSLAVALGLAWLATGVAAQENSSPTALINSALKPTAAPTFTPAAAQGQDLVSIPVTYAITGVLRSEVKDTQFNQHWIRPKPIPAGTPVFGFPTNHPSGLAPHPGLLWCAVSSEPNGAETRWSVTCFPQVKRVLLKLASAFVPLSADLFPASFSVPYSFDEVPAPDIEERAVDLTPPLSISIEFAGWDHNAANLGVIIHQPKHASFSFQVPGTQVLARMRLPRDSTGAAHLPLFGGEIFIRPGPDGKSAVAELARPFSSGAPVR